MSAITDEDRAMIRRIIVQAGAPERDIKWLVASCPSILLALTYRAPTAPVPIAPTTERELRPVCLNFGTDQFCDGRLQPGYVFCVRCTLARRKREAWERARVKR